MSQACVILITLSWVKVSENMGGGVREDDEKKKWREQEQSSLN